MINVWFIMRFEKTFGRIVAHKYAYVYLDVSVLKNVKAKK